MIELTPQDLTQQDALDRWSAIKSSRESLGPPSIAPLILLALEGSDGLWFHLGAMSPNLCQWSVTSPEIRRIPYGTGRGLFQSHTRQVCKMSKRINKHILQVEGTMVTKQHQYPLIDTLSEVFLDGVSVGEAVMEGFRSWSHPSGPAYVAIGGLLLGIHAPKLGFAGMYGPPSHSGLRPPIIDIWLRTTKVETKGLSVKEHFQDSHRRVGQNPPAEMWRTRWKKQPDKYLRVRKEVRKTTDWKDVWEPYNNLWPEESPLLTSSHAQYNPSGV